MARHSEEDEGYLRETARQCVRGGYEDAAQIEESLIDQVADWDAAPSGPAAKRLVRSVLIEEIEALLRDQAGWPPMTDHDRLRLAFDKLEDEGIIAREHFTCCGTCGAAEIGGEIEAFEANGPKAKGYVFFHVQDTESAVEGHGLYFNYGAFTEPHDANSVGVGRRLFDTLASVGLTPDWNGKLSTRVKVSLDWKRPWTDPVPTPIKRWFF